MPEGTKRKQRRIALTGAFTLEGRALLSLVGHSNLALPPAHIRGLPQVAEPAVHHAAVQFPAAARVANHADHHLASAGVLPTSARWSWLANTYWYVPVANLPATLYNSASGTVTSVSDQTVFHITDYRRGYFWGDVVTQLNSGSPSSSFMVGSVTPEGKVLLTFTSTGSQSSPSITNGYGTMEQQARCVDHGEPDVHVAYGTAADRPLGLHGANASGQGELVFAAVGGCERARVFE